jgi:hypothetical protein
MRRAIRGGFKFVSIGADDDDQEIALDRGRKIEQLATGSAGGRTPRRTILDAARSWTWWVQLQLLMGRGALLCATCGGPRGGVAHRGSVCVRCGLEGVLADTLAVAVRLSLDPQNSHTGDLGLT